MLTVQYVLNKWQSIYNPIVNLFQTTDRYESIIITEVKRCSWKSHNLGPLFWPNLRESWNVWEKWEGARIQLNRPRSMGENGCGTCVRDSEAEHHVRGEGGRGTCVWAACPCAWYSTIGSCSSIAVVRLSFFKDLHILSHMKRLC